MLYSRSYSIFYPRVKSGRDDIVSRQVIADQVCKSLGSSKFHLVVDIAGAGVKCPAKNAGEHPDNLDILLLSGNSKGGILK